MDAKIASYNMRSFRNGCSVLDSLRNDNKSDVIFVQDHWLLPNNVNLFANFKANYAGFAVSGCCDIEQFE